MLCPLLAGISNRVTVHALPCAGWAGIVLSAGVVLSPTPLCCIHCPPAAELLHFGAIHSCPVPPVLPAFVAAGMPAAQVAVQQRMRAEAEQRAGRSSQLRTPQRLAGDVELSQHSYIRVHLNPKRFPAVYSVDWRVRWGWGGGLLPSTSIPCIPDQATSRDFWCTCCCPCCDSSLGRIPCLPAGGHSAKSGDNLPANACLSPPARLRPALPLPAFAFPRALPLPAQQGRLADPRPRTCLAVNKPRSAPAVGTIPLAACALANPVPSPTLCSCQPLALQGRIVAETREYLVVDKPHSVPAVPTVDNQLECALSCAAAAAGHPAPLYTTSRLDQCTEGVLVLGG